MRKALGLFLVLVLTFSVNVNAIYFFEPKAIERESGSGVIGFPEKEDVMLPSSNGKTVEDVILDGWASFSEEIDVEEFEIREEDLEELYSGVFYNNPLYYYVGRKYEYYYIQYDGEETRYIVSIIPSYTTTDYNEVSSMHKAIEEEADNILLYIENDMTDFEKVMTVHDYMVIHYDYDHTLENHSISIMVTKTGVCESYTFAFMYIMDLLGIEARYVSSEAMNHAWNLVKLDGKWYHIDLTWDDSGCAVQTNHIFQLLSDKKIQSMDDPHYDYDTGGLVADSDIYDDALWHENHSQIVALSGTDYWVEGAKLVSSRGEVICPALDGGDGKWSIGDGYSFREDIYAGLAVFGGKLYYNTDKGIFVYNPLTKKSLQILEVDGVCGIHIDGNILKHGMFDREEGKFYEADDTVKLSGARITVPFIKNGKAIAKIYNDGSENINILSFGKNGAEIKEAQEGVTTVEVDVNMFDCICFMNDKLNPLHNKVTINN